MSVRRARLLVWIALLLAMPVPLVIVGHGRVPVGTLAQLSAVTLGVAILERADGAVVILAAVLLAQGMLWSVLTWLVARVVIRGIHGLAGRGAGTLVVALVAAGLVAAALLPIYRSPFHASRARQTLLEVYG